MLLLQHITRGALRKPSLAPIIEVGVAPSVCHLSPARKVRGVSHAMCLAILPLVIQTGRYLRSAVSMDEAPALEVGDEGSGNLDFSFPPAAPK